MAATREAVTALARSLEHTLTPDDTYRLYVQHLYRRALKGSRGRSFDVLAWRRTALSIRLQFEAHAVQPTNQERSRHLARLEDIAKEWEDAQPIVEPTAPDGTKWQRHFARRSENDLEYAARLSFTRNRDEDYATINKDWYSDAYTLPREETTYGYELSALTIDAIHIDPALAEKEARAIEHNRERLLKQRERAKRSPAPASLPTWRPDIGGNLEEEGLREPGAPVAALSGVPPVVDSVAESELQLSAARFAEQNKQADDIISRINAGEILEEQVAYEIRDFPTERIMDIRDALFESMMDKRHALQDAMQKREKLDSLVAKGLSEAEAKKELEAKGIKLESVNRLLNRPPSNWQGLDLTPPHH